MIIEKPHIEVLKARYRYAFESIVMLSHNELIIDKLYINLRSNREKKWILTVQYNNHFVEACRYIELLNISSQMMFDIFLFNIKNFKNTPRSTIVVVDKRNDSLSIQLGAKKYEKFMDSMFDMMISYHNMFESDPNIHESFIYN